jgi:glutamyl-tRNA reductase
VEEEVDAFVQWFERHEAEEAIGELVARARGAARAELGKLWERLPNVEAQERAEIDAAITRIVNRILHEPIAVLKAESQSSYPIDITQIVREVCRLDETSEEPGEDAADA